MTIEGSKQKLLKENSNISITGLDATLATSSGTSSSIAVPATTDTIVIPSSGNAPKLSFSATDAKDATLSLTAQGIVGSEMEYISNDNGTTTSKMIVHLSYTIFDAAGEKYGSMYIKLKYAESVHAQKFVTTSDKTIEFSYAAAYEEATTFSGKASTDGTNDDPTDDVTYIVGSPVTYHISLNEYYKLITGESLNWSDEQGSQTDLSSYANIGKAAFIVINTSRSIINNNFEGFYLGITDNMFVNPSDDYTYDAIDSVKITTKYYDPSKPNATGLIDNAAGTGDFHSLNSNRLSFFLDSNYQGSVSRVLTRNITSMDISTTEFDDTISMGLFKLTKNTTSSDILKLNYNLREKYNWSFGKTRLKSSSTATTPVSYFAENVVEDSNNLTILINPNVAKKGFVDNDGVVRGKMRIFGNKLVANLNNFEDKYLLRSYISNATTISSTQTVSALVPSRLAKSSIESWRSIISQAGVSPSFLSTISDIQPLNSLIPFGTYTEETTKSKIIGQVPAKLERALELVENDEEYPDIDIVLEGGLGTIFAYSCNSGVAGEADGGNTKLLLDNEMRTKSIINEDDDNTNTFFDENAILNGVEDLRTGRTSISDAAQDFIDNYRAIQTVFTNFANSMQNGGRGDCFYISDVPRGILIKGKNTKITDLYGSTIDNNTYDFGEGVNHSFTTSVLYPIKHTFDTVVSSYMSTYAQWVKVLDSFSTEKVWIPVSGYIAGNMAATDGTYGPWYAAAGLRRGVISGVLDYALSPSVTQRTDLYKICINSVPKIPNYGVTIWGIRTMSKAASAFDQNTCRRTFLYMEKKVKQTLRYYIFEPNTSYTRLQIVNDLDPFLEKVKNAGGIYSYTLVCDTTNNTPDVINNGDLAVSIAAAPTRTAENIVVEFTANKYTEEVSAAESIQ